MPKLDWSFFTGNAMTKLDCTITYGHHKVNLYAITDKQRQALVNLLISLEKDLSNAARDD